MGRAAFERRRRRWPLTAALFGVLLAAAASLVALAPGAGAQGDEGRVRFINALMGQPVDVYVAGRILVADLAAGDTQDLTPLAGRQLRQVEVRRSRTSSVLVGPLGSLTVPESGYQTWVVHLDAAGVPVLTRYDDDRTPVAAGKARLTVRHVAAAGAVDLAVTAGPAQQVMASSTGLASGGQFGADLDAGIADRIVVGAGGDVLLDLQPLTLQAGEQLTVYVMGGAGGAPLTPISFVTANLVVIPNRVDSGFGPLPGPDGAVAWPSPAVLVSALLATAVVAFGVTRLLDARSRASAADAAAAAGRRR